MTKNLVIVESPAKARTIERYLGDDYRVLASYGHVRDLPENPGKGKLGVDVEHEFAPEYVINEDRRKQVNAIAKAAKGSDLVYLATDLDREGEAIAWHVVEAAHIPSEKTRRVTFSEITEPAIREAFANPRDIDLNLVDAQQTRRIVDRLVGYTLSPLLSRKVRGGLSAGRVQSVAVRLVVEREREIEAFTAREYWTIEAILATAAGDTFAAELVRDRRRGRSTCPTRPRPSGTPTALRDAHPVVRKIGVRTRSARPRRRSRPARSSRRPAASCRSARSGRCRSRSGSTRASRDRRPRRAHHLHADRLDGDRRRGDGRGPRGRRRALRRAVRDAQGPRLQDHGRRVPRRPTRRSGRRASDATPTRSRARSSPRSCASTG